MSSPLSEDLFQRFHVSFTRIFAMIQVRSISVRKDDEVRVLRGKFKSTEGKAVACYRKKYVIHMEKCTRDKANGPTVHVEIDGLTKLFFEV